MPGDVPGIRDAADHYQQITTALTTTRDDLDTVMTRGYSTDMISEAVDAIRQTAQKVRDAVDQVSGRYCVVAGELHSFATSLDATQTQADWAEGDAQAATQAVKEAQQNEAIYNDQINKLKLQIKTQQHDDPTQSDPTTLQRLQDKLAQAQRQLREVVHDISDAQGRIETASNDLDTALATWNTAAEQVSDTILSQLQCDGLNDTWWLNWGQDLFGWAIDLADWFVDSMAEILDGISKMIEGLMGMLDALETGDRDKFTDAFLGMMDGLSLLAGALSSLLGAIATVLSFIPGLQEAALGFSLASVIVAGVQVLADVVLAANHRKSWSTVGEEAVLALAGAALRGLSGPTFEGALRSVLPANVVKTLFADDTFGAVLDTFGTGLTEYQIINNQELNYSMPSLNPSYDWSNMPESEQVGMATMFVADAYVQSEATSWRNWGNTLDNIKNDF